MPDTAVIRTLSRTALSRIFENVLGNAVKYSDGDLKITLKDSGEIIFSNSACTLNAVTAGRLFDRFLRFRTAKNQPDSVFLLQKFLPSSAAAEYLQSMIKIY